MSDDETKKAQELSDLLKQKEKLLEVSLFDICKMKYFSTEDIQDHN